MDDVTEYDHHARVHFPAETAFISTPAVWQTGRPENAAMPDAPGSLTRKHGVVKTSIAEDRQAQHAWDQHRIRCALTASHRYRVPTNVLLAVSDLENGKPGQWVRNRNGTHDVGPMQFNTAYLADLARFGIRPEHVAKHDCYPFELAAWRLQQHITRDPGEYWTRVANYHSRTPQHNYRYREKLLPAADRWARRLMRDFPQHEILGQP